MSFFDVKIVFQLFKKSHGFYPHFSVLTNSDIQSFSFLVEATFYK